MTTVNLTLLLGFLIKKPTSEEKEKRNQKLEKRQAKAKAKIPKETKNVTLSPKPDLKMEPLVTIPKNLFEVGSPKKFAHIEYELLPERVPFKVDVNCWGDFAKIYCDDDVRVIRTIQINEVAWVPIKIKHFFKQMTKTELLQLQLHVIKVTIWSQQDKLEQEFCTLICFVSFCLFFSFLEQNLKSQMLFIYFKRIFRIIILLRPLRNHQVMKNVMQII